MQILNKFHCLLTFRLAENNLGSKEQLYTAYVMQHSANSAPCYLKCFLLGVKNMRKGRILLILVFPVATLGMPNIGVFYVAHQYWRFFLNSGGARFVDWPMVENENVWLVRLQNEILIKKSSWWVFVEKYR